jgi:hypothetical protein
MGGGLVNLDDDAGIRSTVSGEHEGDPVSTSGNTTRAVQRKDSSQTSHDR